MPAPLSIKKICRTARMRKAAAADHSFDYLRDLCASAATKAATKGCVIGPAGGHCPRTTVTAAIRHEAAALRLGRRSKRRPS